MSIRSVYVAALRAVALITAFLALSFSAQAGSPEGAKEYASSIGSRVLAILNDTGTDQGQKMDALEVLFVKVVDVEWVGKFVLGTHWRAATDAQKAAYMEAYRTFLIKHYTSRFADYGGETFDLPISREERKGEYFVRMEIKRPMGQAPVIVDYRLRENADNTYRVFDIIVEGVSLIATQRSEFGSVVSRKGLDDLTAKLKNKTDKLDAEMRAPKKDKK